MKNRIKIEILKELVFEIKKKFNKSEANKILDLLETLKENPRKGKLLGSVGGIIIKELRYRNYRFYFITNGFKLKCFDENSLIDILLRFVRMSDKKHQKKVINEIREILLKIESSDF